MSPDIPLHPWSWETVCHGTTSNMARMGAAYVTGGCTRHWATVRRHPPQWCPTTGQRESLGRTVPITTLHKDHMSELLTVAQLSQRLGVTPRHCQRIIRAGSVPVILTSNGWRVRSIDARILLLQRGHTHAK